MEKTEKKDRPEEAFVAFVIRCIEKDKGITADLCRADNIATEYQSWEYLAACNIALNNPCERLPYTTVAAAMAKAKIEANGSKKIGKLLASCYEDGANSNQAKIKLRRLLACNSVEEACRILRSLLSLIRSRSNTSHDLNFIQLLKDLHNFRWDHSRQKVKSQWAQDFFQVEAEKKEKA